MKRYVPRGAKVRRTIDPRSGRRVKIVVLPNGKIFDRVNEGVVKHRRTRTSRHLERMKRRIGL